MTAIRPRRSALYMPGSNARALEKAKALPADVVILDLEDAVAPAAKNAARDQVAAAVGLRAFGPREVVVRINGLASEWGRADLLAIAAVGPDAILLPKVASADDVAVVQDLAEAAGIPDATRLWAMMELPIAVLDPLAIARAAEAAGSRLTAFVMGTNDLAKETGMRQVAGRAPMLGWLADCVAAARAVGLIIFDGVHNDFRDDAGLEAACEQGRDLGMDGKTLIHPGQLAICNRVFSPSATEVEDARRLIEAFAAPENAGKAAIAFNGGMAELLHAEIAQRTVALADAIAARDAEAAAISS
ncbi:MAG: CoA ester lyase [Proteobacteria bacterium]|nr:CoA ester lyase [Pseudomonadota bacterium]